MTDDLRVKLQHFLHSSSDTTIMSPTDSLQRGSDTDPCAAFPLFILEDSPSFFRPDERFRAQLRLQGTSLTPHVSPVSPLSHLGTLSLVNG